jgi:hypothetical protein
VRILANQTKGAAALVQIPHSKTITNREDLSFTLRDDEYGLVSWSVPHDKQAYWTDGLKIGEQHFSEVAELAQFNEYEAFTAIQLAMNTPGWRPYGWGIEMGFSQALACAAIVGLRALRAGAAPYDHDLEGKRLQAEEDEDS